MIGRGFTARALITGLTGADDLLQFTAPSTMEVHLDKIKVTQGTVVTVEIKQLIVQRASAAGTGGAITPEEKEPGGPAASSTVLTNTSTNATLTGAPIESEQWNFLMPYQWHPKEGSEITIPPSGVLVIRMNEAPAGATDFEVVVDFREVG